MNARFEFSGSPELNDLVREISATMVLLFDIPLAEADGRINRFWGRSPEFNETAETVVLHETAEYWAKTIYYGPLAMWWLGESDLEPTPYP